MKQLSDYERKSLNKLGESIHAGNWSNEGMVELIKLLLQYLNPIPLQKYADNEGITYPGALKRNQHIDLLNRRYVIDNE